MSFVGFGSYTLGDDENNNAVATCRLLANALPFRSLGCSTHSAGSWLIVRSTPLGLRVHSLVAVAESADCRQGCRLRQARHGNLPSLVAAEPPEAALARDRDHRRDILAEIVASG